MALHFAGHVLTLAPDDRLLCLTCERTLTYTEIATTRPLRPCAGAPTVPPPPTQGASA